MATLRRRSFRPSAPIAIAGGPAHRFYDEFRRLAAVEPVLAPAAALPPWEALPDWGRRRLARCAGTEGGAGSVEGTVRRLLEDGFAEARALVEAWLDAPMDSPSGDVEALVRDVAGKLFERDLRSAVARGEIDEG